MLIARWIDRIHQHLRYGLRGLRREPAFALTALLTLALGSAATTTVFSVVDAELWRPLPYPDASRLMAAGSKEPLKGRLDGITIVELQAWRERVTAFESLTTTGTSSRRTAQLGHAESVVTSEVTADFFTTLRRGAIRGRVFTPGDAAGAAVLTERGWRRIFGGDPSALGRTFTLDGSQVTIVAIVATDDSLGTDPDLYLPIDERDTASPRLFYSMVGRLAPGASATTAAQQLQAAIDHHATIDVSRAGHRAFAEDLSSSYRTSNARQLYFFLGASVLVMLLTIANVAGLIVSRAVRRTPEFALRSAIGGNPGTLAAQLIAEGALVALPGCAIGLLLANIAVGALEYFVPDDFLYRGTRIAIDSRVVIATLAMALITTAGLALVPLGIVRRIGERAALGSGSRTGETPASSRTRGILLAGQLALTVTLLAGAGVFARSFLALTQVPLGFDPSNAWSIRLGVTGPRFENEDALRTYVGDVVDKLKAVPGIQSAAVATSSPLRSGQIAQTTTSPPQPSVEPVGAIYRAVGPEYFLATGTLIRRGRGITIDDRPGAPTVAVVNEEFVRRVFGPEDPIGRVVEFSGRGRVGKGIATIVGVASDIKEVGLNEVRMADIYLPFAQRPSTAVELIARGVGADPAMSASLRAAVADPLVPITGMASLQLRVDQAMQNERFHLIVVALFAVIAVLTASIGVYGAMAYAVTARWREFGVRVALGASPGHLIGGTLWQAARLGMIGAVVGVIAALALARWIGDALYLVPGSHNGLLYDTKTTDPIAMIAAVAGILALVIAAGAIPARRAARIDPVEALRAD